MIPPAWLPHSYCLEGSPDLVAYFAVANFIIFISYYFIALKLRRLYHTAYESSYRVIVAQQDNLVLIAFAMFIFACGLTHLMDVITLWFQVYGLTAMVLGVCAVFSAFTAWLLITERIRFQISYDDNKTDA